LARDLLVLGNKLGKIDVKMSISTLVISDVNRFAGMKDFWDRELRDHVNDPFFYSCMLIEHWKFSQRVGWHPFLMVFLSSEKIVGFAPLLMRSRFGFRYVSNFDQYTCPEFFYDNYHEVCLEQMVNVLFRHLNCESADITVRDESADQRLLEKVCRKKNLRYTRFPQEGQAIIPVKSSLNFFRQSLNRKDVREFKRIGRKLDKLGSWQISCFGLDRASLTKIWEVERHSWKAYLKGKEKAKKDLGLSAILKGVERNGEGVSYFESEVWFLELNGVPLSYVLTMKRNKTLFFAKTSYDSRYKDVSPGTFLMNSLIEQVFMNGRADKIDFISNLPVLNVWKPLVVKRITYGILRNVFLSKARRLVFENRVCSKALQILERFKWKRRPN
jgi:hypothetical protein